MKSLSQTIYLIVLLFVLATQGCAQQILPPDVYVLKLLSDAEIAHQQGNQQKSRDKCEEALRASETIEDPQGKQSTLDMIATTCERLSQPAAKPVASAAPESSAEIDALLENAESASTRGMYQEALNKVEEALTLWEKMETAAGPPKRIWNTFTDVMIDLRLRENEQILLDLRPRILAFVERIGIQDHAAEVYFNDIGKMYEEEGEYDQALYCYQRAVAILRVLGDENAESYGVHRIGTLYEMQHQYEKALEFYQQARAKRQEAGDVEGEIEVLHKITYVYHRIPQFHNALKTEREILALQEAGGVSSRDVGMTLGRIGSIYDMLGQYAEALDFYHQALEMTRKEVEGQLQQQIRQSEIANLLSFMAYIYRDLGLYEKAIELQEQTIERFSQMQGSGSAVVHSLIQIAQTYQMSGQYEKALDILEQALAMARENTERDLQPIMEELEQAKASGKDTRQLEMIEGRIAFQTLLGKNTEAFVLDALGELYTTWGDNERALAFYQQALDIFQEYQSDEARGLSFSEGRTREQIGTVYVNMGQYEQALTTYEQALTIYRELGQNMSSEESALNHLGVVYEKLGQYEQAVTLHQQALKLAETFGLPDMIWHTNQAVGRSMALAGNYTEALEHYESALDLIETLRAGLKEKEHKSGFMRGRISVYDELINLLYKLHQKHPDQGYDRKALEIFERKQGRVFLEEMGKSGARLFAGFPEEIVQREQNMALGLEQMREKLTEERLKPPADQDTVLIQALQAREKAILAEQEALQNRIKADYPDYYALKYPEPVTLDKLQQVLHPEELMLIFNVMQENSCVWLIGPDTFGMYSIKPGEDALAGKVASLREALYSDWGTARGLGVTDQIEKEPETQKSFVRESYDLYATLIPESVRPLLTSPRTVNIVPTGPLYALPFEFLLTRPAQSFRDVHYLIEEIPISYLSSASLLKTLREARTRRTETAQYPLLAFANPAYEENSQDSLLEGWQGVSATELRGQVYRGFMRGEFEELPETEDEARAIANLFNAPEESDPLQLRADASHTNVLTLNSRQSLDDYDYLVFAMHGVLPGEVDYLAQSALVLSDDFLTMADVFGLQLNAKVVALSACNTGMGTQVKGEGVMGLTRAFMYAGTPAVAVTLWSVESLSAMELDIGFFRYLKDNLPPARALQMIKVQMLRGEAGDNNFHPYYWAPFVLFGDGM